MARWGKLSALMGLPLFVFIAMLVGATLLTSYRETIVLNNPWLLRCLPENKNRTSWSLSIRTDVSIEGKVWIVTQPCGIHTDCNLTHCLPIPETNRSYYCIPKGPQMCILSTEGPWTTVTYVVILLFLLPLSIPVYDCIHRKPQPETEQLLV